MCDQSFLEPSVAPLPGSTAEIPDIFDVLAGGEDEGTVRYLLGYQEGGGGLMGCVEGFTNMGTDEQLALPITTSSTYQSLAPTTTISTESTGARCPVVVRPAQPSDAGTLAANKKRDTSGSKAIHNCDSCGKSFTTKFNLKRHINMHCHKSKENGVPLQGPPSASAPAKKIPEAQAIALNVNNPQQSRQAPTLNWSPAPVLQYPDMANNNQGEVGYHLSRPQEYSLAPTEPDSTYRLPSVQTLLPISTVYTLGKTYTSNTTTCNAFSSSPPSLCSPPSSHNNTDYGTLPADLFEPDSSESAPPTPPHSSRDSLPSSPSSPMVILTAVPPGWNRRVVVEQGRPVAKYFSPIGKRFSCYEEVAAFFQRQNYSVPRHLFTFSVEEDLEGESSEESDLADFDSEPEECESNCPSNAKRRRRVSSLWEEEVGEMVASCPPWSPPPSSGAQQIPVSSPNIASPSVTEVHH